MERGQWRDSKNMQRKDGPLLQSLMPILLPLRNNLFLFLFYYSFFPFPLSFPTPLLMLISYNNSELPMKSIFGVVILVTLVLYFIRFHNQRPLFTFRRKRPSSPPPPSPSPSSSSFPSHHHISIPSLDTPFDEPLKSQ